MAGEITITHISSHQISEASLITAVNACVLAAATDYLFIIPKGGNSGEVAVIAANRAA